MSNEYLRMELTIGDDCPVVDYGGWRVYGVATLRAAAGLCPGPDAAHARFVGGVFDGVPWLAVRWSALAVVGDDRVFGSLEEN